MITLLIRQLSGQNQRQRRGQFQRQLHGQFQRQLRGALGRSPLRPITHSRITSYC